MMFNSITKKLKGEQPPPKKNEGMEGFICPMCLASFTSSEMVQQHFEENHPEDDNSKKNVTESVFSPNTQRKESIRDIQENLNDLRQSLDEEVWYNEELKKECTRLNAIIAEKDKEVMSRDNTIEDYIKQITDTEVVKEIATAELKKLQISRASLEAENKTIRSDFRVCEEKLIALERIRDELVCINENKSTEYDNLFREFTELKSISVAEDKNAPRLSEQLSDVISQLDLKDKQLLSVSNELMRLKTQKDEMVTELETKCVDLSTQVEDLQSERSSLTHSSEKLVSDYQNKYQSSTIECEELKLKVDSLKSKLNESEDELTKIKRHLDSIQTQNEDLNTKLKDSVEECQLVRTQNHELNQRIKNHEVEILQIRNVCSNKEEEIKTLQKSAKTSSEECVRLMQQLDIERDAKDDLQSKVEMTDAANIVMEQMQLERKSLQENISQLKRQLDEETERASSDLSLSRMEIQSLKEEVLNLTSLISEKEQKIKESEKTSSDVQIVCEKYQQKVNEEAQSRSNLEDKIMTLKREILSKEEALKASVESHLSLKKEYDQSIMNNEKELNNAKEDLVNLNKQIALLKSKASQVPILENQIEMANTKVEELGKELQQLSTTRNNLQQENSTIKNNEKELQSKLAENENFSKKLEVSLKEKNMEIESQLVVIETKENFILDLQRKILDNTGIISGLNDELTALKELVNGLNIELKDKDAEIARCRQSIETIESELNQSSEDKAHLESEITVAKQSILDKDGAILQLGKDKENLENSCIEKQRDIDELKVTIDSTNCEKKSLEVELSMAKIQTENIQQLYSESMKQQNTIENDLRRVTEEHRRVSKLYEDLQAAHETLQTQHETETEQLRKEATQSRNRVLALEKTLNESSENYQQERLESTERELTLKSQCEDHEANLIKLTKSLQRTEEDLESEKCLRQTERNNMMEKISQLTEQIAETETLRNDFDQKLESAETENIENKIRLEAAKDEKDKLLEKIIQLENNLKKQNDGFTKKCREFDQLQSAILDLGRENQSLQITKEKITNRLWIIDDEALECHNCHKPFSLTHRKHHCRNCGQVFCQDCSTKTATLAVSRNPVRVCDSCHVEVNSHRRNSSAQSSNISLSLQN